MSKPRVILPAKPLVAVEWEDAFGSATDVVSDANIDAKHHPITILTVGWMMLENDRGVSLCSEYCGDGDYRGHTFILASMVKAVRILKGQKARQSEQPETACSTMMNKQE